MEFRLLGPFEVVQDGRPVALGGRRQRVVLAHLVLRAGVPVPRDSLIELVWGEGAPRAAAASLHTYVSRLRSALGAARLETRSTGYLLHVAAQEVDALRFEQGLVHARAVAASDPSAAAERYGALLRLWRGPALGQLADEESLAGTAARLEHLRQQAVEEQVALRLACGDHVALVPELRDLVLASPLREDLWAHLVLALYRCGRQAEALAAVDEVRRLLQDALGVDPGPALRRLHAQVLAQDPALSPTGELHGYQLHEVLGRGPTATVHRAVQPVVGREVALKVLHPAVSDSPELVSRFSSAAQAAAAVEHPCVVPLYDCWRGPGGAVLVLRLLRGGTLAQRLRAGPVDLAQLLPVLEQVAAGLDACSRQGIVHAHLSADDVLLDAHGHAHVASFVLARELSRARAPAGSPAAGGAVRDDGTRPDVRALAALLGGPALPAAVREGAARALAAGPPDAQSLVAAVKEQLAPAVPAQRTARWRSDEPRNPYKGLRAFTEADAADFAGRSALVQRLVHRLADPPDGEGLRFLAVVGPSGSGKSSVVRAGLVPALHAGAVASVSRWYVVDVVPAETPFQSTEAALRRVAVEPAPPTGAASWRTDPDGLLRAASGLLPDDDDGSAVLLLVDQLEELFTLVAADERRAFLDALVRAVSAPGSRVRVVVTLRADCYDRPLAHPRLAELLRAGTEVMVPLTPEGLEQAVVEPAERAGLRVEPALLAQVVADVADAPAALPLLQFALTELAERADDGVLRLDDYREVGGVAGALVQRADGLHARSTAEERQLAQQVLLQLVQPRESGADLRRRVLLDELLRRTDDPETAQSVVTAYGAARLLAFDRDTATRAPTVEVAHEALLREWSVLRDWIAGARDELRARQRLASAAREWDENDRDPSFLAVGARLAALERWSPRSSTSPGWVPSPLERAYVDASLRVRDEAAAHERARADAQRAAERRSVRRLRATAAVLAVAVAAATGLAAFGLAQQDRAERESVVAAARALSAASVASLEVDPERAVLLALAAVERSRSADGAVLPEAEEALHRAVVASRVVLRVSGTGDAADWGAPQVLVHGGADGSGRVALRDARSGRQLRAWRAHRVDVNEVRASPDGRHLLTTGDDGAARLWEAGTGRLVWEVAAGGEVWGPSFSRDGTVVAAAWRGEGAVRVLDARTGALRSRIGGLRQPEGTSLSPDGAAVVVSARGTAGARVHDSGSGRLRRHLDAGGRPAFDVAVSPDGRQVATAGVDGRTRLWDLADGRPRGTLHAGAAVADVAWSPDGARVLVGGDDGVARLFSLADGSTREVLRLASSQLRSISAVAFSPDGRHVLLDDGRTGTSEVWDVSTRGSREWATIEGPAFTPLGADFAADGRRLLASSSGGGPAVHDPADGSRVHGAPPGAGTVRDLRTSPDGALVAGVLAGRLRVWDATTTAEVSTGPVVASSAVPAWSPDGRRLAVVTRSGSVLLLDRQGAALPGPLATARDVVAVAHASDGRRLVTSSRAGGGHLAVHDLATGRLRHRWPADVVVLAAGPDGTLAGAEPGGDLLRWDLGSREAGARLVGHVGRVLDLAVSPDGTRLASAGQDGTVRLWDLRTGLPSVVLRGHDGAVSSVRWSPDGTRLATSSWDGTIRVWALALDDLVRIARDRVTRGLTDDECRRYLLQDACS